MERVVQSASGSRGGPLRASNPSDSDSCSVCGQLAAGHADITPSSFSSNRLVEEYNSAGILPAGGGVIFVPSRLLDPGKNERSRPKPLTTSPLKHLTPPVSFDCSIPNRHVSLRAPQSRTRVKSPDAVHSSSFSVQRRRISNSGSLLVPRNPPTCPAQLTTRVVRCPGTRIRRVHVVCCQTVSLKWWCSPCAGGE